ncbi:MAG: DUF2061 domain-containing protein [Candidatus Diapherotrites archaeon]|nr:DUF2061 domain-containing protein [Candidatus Micrarchaeota archaeon]MBU1939787.1 DUF2061 domain-containing protein [Candidatus Micrarchaeota archaeon]
MKPAQKRIIAKTISFRIIATITTVVLVYIFTGSLELAGTVGALDFGAKLVVYYLHERAWGRTNWGRKIESPPA